MLLLQSVLLFLAVASNAEDASPSLRRRTTNNKVLTCPKDREVLIDFETRPDGTPIEPGEYIWSQFSDLDLASVRATRDGRNGRNWARIFDSAFPTGGDRDLGSPNKNCPGCTPGSHKCPGFAGRNQPGFLVANKTNCVAQNNILIIHEGEVADYPDDYGKGGAFEFTFFPPIQSVISVGMMDIDGTENQIELYGRPFSNQGFDNPVETKHITGLGDNTWQEVNFSFEAEHRFEEIFGMVFDIKGSGAITSIRYCRSEDPIQGLDDCPEFFDSPDHSRCATSLSCFYTLPPGYLEPSLPHLTSVFCQCGVGDRWDLGCVA